MAHIGRSKSWKRTDRLIALSVPLLAAFFVLLIMTDSSPTRPRVAPLFIHGTGAGLVTGHAAPSRSVLTSEDEALAVIREELAKAGLTVSANQVPLAGIVIVSYREKGSLFDIQGSLSEKPTGNIVKVESEFVPDLGDPRYNIFVEYVAIAEYPWLEDRPNPGRLDHFTAPRSAAEKIRLKAITEGKGAFTFAVFYDPLATFEKSSEEEPGSDAAGIDRTYEDAKAVSRRLLRLQVGDFIEWLAACGVIDATGSPRPDDSVTQPRDDDSR